MTHRVTRKTIVRASSHEYGRQVLEAGDEFEPTEDELRAFGDRIEPVEEDDEFSLDEWLEQPYEERVASVEDGEVDDHLEEIVDNETSTQVEDAAEERMTEFGTAYSDDESEEEEDDDEE